MSTRRFSRDKYGIIGIRAELLMALQDYEKLMLVLKCWLSGTIWQSLALRIYSYWLCLLKERDCMFGYDGGRLCTLSSSSVVNVVQLCGSVI